MKASNFPIAYKLYVPDEGIFLEGEAVTARGFTLTADGLPYYTQLPFGAVVLWFSGQMDKNKTMIFEGDICKMKVRNAFGSLSESLAIMKWIPQQYRFILMMGVKKADNNIYDVIDVEKIGHELTHPDLAQKIADNANPNI